MTYDEEENAVRQLGELIGYSRLVEIALILRRRWLVEQPSKIKEARVRMPGA